MKYDVKAFELLSNEEIAEIAKLTVEEVKALDENYSS